MNMKLFAERQSDYQLMVFKALRRKFPKTPDEELYDAYSEALVKILKHKDEIKSEEPISELIMESYRVLDTNCKEANKFERYVNQGLPFRQSIDFNLFDKRFKNYLTDEQRVIYEMRCAHIPPRQSGLNKTRNNINQQTYKILKRYKEWVDRMTEISKIHPSELDIFDDHQRQVMEYYLEGYSVINISKELRISNTEIHAIIFKCKCIIRSCRKGTSRYAHSKVITY